MVPTRAAAVCCAFLFFASVAIAEKKIFNVVSFGNAVEVQVNGKRYAMKRSYESQPLYTAEVETSGKAEYRYIEDDKEENFKRDFPAGASATFNDFFGRKDTIKSLPQLPKPFLGQKNGQWTRGMGQVKPFNETYVATMHFTGPEALTFFQKAPKKAKGAISAFFILQDETKLFTGVELEASNKRFPKFAIKMSLKEGDEYYGRNVYKFRFGENDPTFMREKLYTDLLVAVGAPVHQTGLIRVYANGEPIGLYILQDETADEKFIQSEFYAKGDVPSSLGYPLDAGTGADFLWTEQSRDPVDPWDAFDARKHPGRRNYRSDATNDRVVELSRALNKLNPNNEAAVAEFDKKWFDIDVFFKAMALEYLLGHWDSYWGLTTNFVVYDDPNESDPPNNYKFYFLDQDFEFSFGSCIMSHQMNEYGREYTKQSYKTLLDRTWTKEPLDAPRRTMIDKLISGPALTKRFENILVTIVEHLLNPVAFFGRIDHLADRYREEIKWDRSLTRLRVGTMNNNWTLKDLDYGIDGYPPGVESHGVDWGLKPYIQERADAVAKEFKFDYTKPDNSAKRNNDNKNIEDLEQSNNGTASVSSDVEKPTASVMTFVVIASSVMIAVVALIG